MKLIVPIYFKDISPDIEFPLQLFESEESGKVTVERFSISERERMFHVTNLKVTEKETSHKPTTKSLLFTRTFDVSEDPLRSNTKIIIERNTDNPNDLQRVLSIINFVFKIVFAQELSFAKFDSTIPVYNGMLHSGKSFVSRRFTKKLNIGRLRRAKKVIELLLTNEASPKLSTASSCFTTALENGDLAVAGSFHMAALESVLLQGEKTEITYKLSMRLTKARNKNYEFKTKISKLYGKRSSVFHGNKSSFSKEEVKFLEEQSAWVLEKYIIKPDFFDSVRIDQNLLE